jgi:hypothetical protein
VNSRADGEDEIFVGRFVRILSIPHDGFRYSPAEEAFRQSAVGRVCRIVEPYEGTSEDGLRIDSGNFRVHYAALSADGLEGYSLYVGMADIEPLQATEEMLLLHSEDVWQLLKPFGAVQNTPTFARLAAAFGLVKSWNEQRGCTRPESSPF